MELIVAIVILSIGLLGLAATSGIVMRLIGGGGHQTVAANVALTRFEQLRALSCGRMTSGSAVNRNVQPASVTPKEQPSKVLDRPAAAERGEAAAQGWPLRSPGSGLQCRG